MASTTNGKESATFLATPTTTLEQSVASKAPSQKVETSPEVPGRDWTECQTSHSFTNKKIEITTANGHIVVLFGCFFPERMRVKINWT